LLVAITISGLVAAGVLFAFGIGIRAWRKAQDAAMQLRRTTSIEDGIQLQLSNCVPLIAEFQAGNRKLQAPFFFGEENRVVFATSYSLGERGRGGLVAADYFAERQDDGTWKLWLDERPVLDGDSLAQWFAGIERRQDNLDYPVPRAFDKQNALLLWQGLRGCSFRFRRQFPEPPAWITAWSALAFNGLPAGVELQPRVEAAEWRGIIPTAVAVEMRGMGAPR
jgi:hypothetical protein